MRGRTGSADETPERRQKRVKRDACVYFEIRIALFSRECVLEAWAATRHNAEQGITGMQL